MFWLPTFPITFLPKIVESYLLKLQQARDIAFFEMRWYSSELPGWCCVLNLLLMLWWQSYEPGRGRRPAVFRPVLNWFSSDACLDAVLSEDDDKVAFASLFFMIALSHSYVIWWLCYQNVSVWNNVGVFRSTVLSQPNKAGLKYPSVRVYIRQSGHKKFLWFQWNLVCR